MYLLAGISLSVAAGLYVGTTSGAVYGAIAFLVSFSVACVVERIRFHSAIERRVRQFRKEVADFDKRQADALTPEELEKMYLQR